MESSYSVVGLKFRLGIRPRGVLEITLPVATWQPQVRIISKQLILFVNPMRIQITLLLDSRTPIQVQLPDNVPVRRLLPALVKKLNLPEVQDPQTAYGFTLVQASSGEKIAATKTLAQAGVGDQHQLQLIIEKIGELTPVSGRLTGYDLLRAFFYRFQTCFADRETVQGYLNYVVWLFVVVTGLVNLALLFRGHNEPSATEHTVITVSESSRATETPDPLMFLPEPAVLDYAVIDAEYDRVHDRLVMISQHTPALHIYETISDQQTAIALTYEPLAVAVSPNGQYAAVGHDKFVSLVDLDQAIVLKEISLKVKVFDIVLRDDGWMYVGTKLIRAEQEAWLWAVPKDGSSELAMSGFWSQWSAYYRLHPDGKHLYAANHGISPDDVVRIKLDDGLAVLEHTYHYHSEYEACGNLWLSESGGSVFTACGNVFRTATDPDKDLIYDGKLVGQGAIKSLAHSAAANRILAIPYTNPCTPDDRTYRVEDPVPTLRIYEDINLNLLKEIKLPTYKSRPVTGCFVFINQQGLTFYILVYLPEYGLSGLISSDLFYREEPLS